MASLRWAVPGKTSKGVILTKSDGTEITLLDERYDDDTNTYTQEGDCIKIPGEENSVKVAGFRFSSPNPPTSIFYKRWENGEWKLKPDGRLYEINSDKFDTVELADCPAGSQRGGRRRSSRKQRKSRRRSLKSRRAGRR